MKRRVFSRRRIIRGRLAALLILALAVPALSGCFIMRTLTFSKDAVAPGDTTNIKITSTPAEDVNTGHPFFLLRAYDSAVHIKSGRFDTTGKAGGPKTLVPDTNLAQIATGLDTCQWSAQPPPKRAAGPPVALRTQNAVTEPATRRIIGSSIKLKVVAGATTGPSPVFVASGDWTDDGDGVAEDPALSDDLITCSNVLVTTLIVK